MGSNSFNVALVSAASDGSWIRLISEALPSSDEEHDYSPDVSPDGSRIVFTTFRYKTGWFGGKRTSEIATSALDGSEAHRLTNSAARDQNPVWSPAGASIAFISSGRLHTMRADGSRARNLTGALLATGDPPTWSGDGRYIAFTAWEKRVEARSLAILYTVDRDGSAFHRVSETVCESPLTSRPTWSPEGTQLAFAKKDGDTAGIYISDPDGSNLRLVLPDVEAVHLAWSPDGSEIAFAADGVISLVQPDGSGLRRLSPSNLWGVIQGLAWSPEGSRLAISGDFRLGDGNRGWLLLTMDRDSGEARVLAEQIEGHSVRAAGGRGLG